MREGMPERPSRNGPEPVPYSLERDLAEKIARHAEVPTEPATLEEWVKGELSSRMTRRLAGEDVDMADLQPPEELVRRSVEGGDANTQTAKIETVEEKMEHPRSRLEMRLREAAETLAQEQLMEDAAHIPEVLERLRTVPDDQYGDIELWRGIAYDNGTLEGWVPSDRAKQIILESLGSSYERANAQFSTIPIEYWNSESSMARVKVIVRENEKLDAPPGIHTRGMISLPSPWFDKKNTKRSTYY